MAFRRPVEGDALPPLEEVLASIPPGRQLRIETARIFHPSNRAGLILSHVDPGAPRRVPTRLCPLIIGDEGQTAADLLELVAGALRLADRHAAQRELGLHGE